MATLAYRIVAFWLPIPAGAAAALSHRRKYGEPEVVGGAVRRPPAANRL